MMREITDNDGNRFSIDTTEIVAVFDMSPVMSGYIDVVTNGGAKMVLAIDYDQHFDVLFGGADGGKRF